jgi:AraC-like DNA-binding protein
MKEDANLVSDPAGAPLPERFHRRQPRFEDLQIRLFTAAWTVITPARWHLQNAQSSYWRFYRNHTDGASLEWDGEEYPLRQGHLYFIPAGVRFSTRTVCEVGQFYVHFDLRGFPKPVLHALFSEPISLPRNEGLESLVWETIREQATRPRSEPGGPNYLDAAFQCRLKAILYGAVGLFLQTRSPSEIARYGRLSDALEPVLPALRHIEENLSASLPNRTLAEICCLSEGHFIRRFGECVGQTPACYIQEMRVRAAAQRLLFTEDSIEQIAANTGFGSRYYFTRVFARHMGISPAAYRKSPRH